MSREDVHRGTLKIIEWKAKLEQRNRALSQCLEQKEASLSHVQAKLQEAVSQVEEHKGELKRVSMLKDSLQEKTRSYSSQMRVLQMELRHINKAHDSQKDFISVSKSQKVSLESTLTNLRNKFESCQRSFKEETQSYIEKTDILKKQLRRAQDNLTKEQEEQKTILREHEELTRSKMGLIQEQAGKIKALEENLGTIRQDKALLQEELNDKAKSIEELESSSQARETSDRETMEALNNEIRDLKDGVKREEDVNRENEERLSGLAKKLEMRDNDIKDHESLIKELQLKIEEYKRQKETLMRDISNKEANCEALMKKEQEALARVKTLSSTIMDVDKQKEEIRNEMKSYRMNEIEELKERMSHLMIETANFESQVKETKEECSSKDSLIQQLTSERDLRNKELKVLGSHIKEKDKVVMKLEITLNAVKEEAVELKKSISEKSISSSGNEEKELLLGNLREKETEIASFEKLIQNAKLREEGLSKRVKGLEEQIQMITNKNCRTLKLRQILSDLQACLDQNKKARQDILQAKANDEKEILRLVALTKLMEMESEESKASAESERVKERTLWEYSMKNVQKVKDLEISELKAKEAATLKEVKSLEKKIESLKTASEAKLVSAVKEKDHEIEGLKESVASLQTQTQEPASQEDGESIHRRSGRWSYGSRRRGSGLVLCKEEDSLSSEKPSKRMKTYQRRSLLDS